MACLGTPSSSVDGVLGDGSVDQRHDDEEFQSSCVGAERACGASGMAVTLMGRNPSRGWGLYSDPVSGAVRSDLMGPYDVGGVGVN
jgi:hypothetical protein